MQIILQPFPRSRDPRLRGNQVTAYQNLVAYWTLKKVKVLDCGCFGNGNNAKFFGNPHLLTSNGKFGRAIDFDHNGDYLCRHFAGITTSSYVSASAWVKLDRLGSGGVNDSAVIGTDANDAHTFSLV